MRLFVVVLVPHPVETDADMPSTEKKSFSGKHVHIIFSITRVREKTRKVGCQSIDQADQFSKQKWQ